MMRRRCRQNVGSNQEVCLGEIVSLKWENVDIDKQIGRAHV